jgi:hypothetical protein
MLVAEWKSTNRVEDKHINAYVMELSVIEVLPNCYQTIKRCKCI